MIYAPAMHELSIAEAMLGIIRDEMERCGASRLLAVRVSCGALSQVVPEALSLGFDIMVKDTSLEGARLEIVRQDLLLACGRCQREFAPESGPLALAAPCPHCAQETGHQVLKGGDLLIEHLEVE